MPRATLAGSGGDGVSPPGCTEPILADTKLGLGREPPGQGRGLSFSPW